MTLEQITAVAEEVWGWDKHSSPGLWFDLNRVESKLRTLDDLKLELESWSGFGRTVEAMADREFVLLIDNTPGFVKLKPNLISYSYEGGPVPKLTAKEIIEATHLAALEAKRKEKEDAEGS
ncbi:hypothetical protein LCGC14_0752470 [marine sediment metagenome]|uniref:Uncharacterized protein n=1 Tax=marine sediment metagenome TaxID=412755 RepID=A0A0F9QNF8_9ZZZZ